MSHNRFGVVRHHKRIGQKKKRSRLPWQTVKRLVSWLILVVFSDHILKLNYMRTERMMTPFCAVDAKINRLQRSCTDGRVVARVLIDGGVCYV